MDEEKSVVKVLKPLAFCLWRNEEGKYELGIALGGYFSSTKYLELPGDEYLREISGQKFGWMDTDCNPWVANKYRVSRPEPFMIVEALESNPMFKAECIARGILEIGDPDPDYKATYEKNGMAIRTHIHPDNVWMN